MPPVASSRFFFIFQWGERTTTERNDSLTREKQLRAEIKQLTEELESLKKIIESQRSKIADLMAEVILHHIKIYSENTRSLW